MQTLRRLRHVHKTTSRRLPEMKGLGFSLHQYPTELAAADSARFDQLYCHHGLQRKLQEVRKCTLLLAPNGLVSRFLAARSFSTTRNATSSREPRSVFLGRILQLAQNATEGHDLDHIEAELALARHHSSKMKTAAAQSVLNLLKQRRAWSLHIALATRPAFLELLDRRSSATKRTPAAAYKQRAAKRGGESTDLSDIQRVPKNATSGTPTSVSTERYPKLAELGMDAPVPDRRGNSKLVAKLEAARKLQPAHTVLSMAKRLLSSSPDLPPQQLVSVLVGQDVYKVQQVQSIAQELGTIPNTATWTQATRNALRVSGVTDAASVIHHVYTRTNTGASVGEDVVLQTIRRLASNSEGYTRYATGDDFKLAFKLFQLHSRSKNHTEPLRTAEAEAMSAAVKASLLFLVAGVMSDFTLPDRIGAVDEVLRYSESRNLPLIGESPDETVGVHACVAAAVRCTNHRTAHRTLVANQQLSRDTFIKISRMIMRFRYADAVTSPYEVLEQITAYARARGWNQDCRTTFPRDFLQSITSSLNRLHVEGGRGLAPVSCTSHNRMPVTDQHLARALEAIRRVEASCTSAAAQLVAPQAVQFALQMAYVAHKNARDDVRRLQAVLTDRYSANTSPISAQRQLQALMLPVTFEELELSWREISSDAQPITIPLATLYLKRLLGMRRFARAVEHAQCYIPDDPDDPSTMKVMARLLAETEGSSHASSLCEAYPVICADPRTRELINMRIRQLQAVGRYSRERSSTTVY